jgi:hypothetical protein
MQCWGAAEYSGVGKVDLCEKGFFFVPIAPNMTLLADIGVLVLFSARLKTFPLV